MADTIDVTDAAVFIPEIWSSEVLYFRESALVMAPLVMRYDALVKGKGDIIHVPNLSELTANDKTANNEVTLNTALETDTDININNHKECSFEIEDIVEVQSQYESIVPLASNCYRKLCEFGESLRQKLSVMVTASQALIREGVETMCVASLWDDEIVRAYVKA